MSNLLVIKSSAGGGASVSNRLVDEFVGRLLREQPGLAVVEHDLDRDPVPHIRHDTLAGIGRPAPETDAARPARRLSDALIAELQAASVIVIGAPMYNFGIPSTLKSWFDHVIRAGATFSYGASGFEGLVATKPVIVIETRGGLYSEGPAAPLDAQEPHLRGMLDLMGLTDVQFVRVEQLGMGAAEEQIAAAITRLSAISMPALARAA